MYAVQSEVSEWMTACFGAEIANDKDERNHRFIEEAIELVQSLGMGREDVHKLVDYVFDRQAGDPMQEVGGVLITLAALCNASNMNMAKAFGEEVDRIWKKIDEIREKQKNKPHGSVYPEALPAAEIALPPLGISPLQPLESDGGDKTGD